MRRVDVAVERQQEQARVQVVPVEEARVAAKPRVETARFDLGSDRLSLGPEPVGIQPEAVPLVQLDELGERGTRVRRKILNVRVPHLVAEHEEVRRAPVEDVPEEAFQLPNEENLPEVDLDKRPDVLAPGGARAR